MFGMTHTKHTARTELPPGNGLAASPLPDLITSLRDNILEAQDLLATGNTRGAEALGKATLQLIRALEAQVRLEASQKDEQREGVFYARDDIEAARAELMRRLDRIAKTIRPDEMGGADT